MLFTTHSIFGAAVGAATGNAYAGFLVGFLSHHVLDSLPHFDQGSFKVKRSWPHYLDKKEEKMESEYFGLRDWIILFIDVSFATALFGIIILYTKIPWTLIFSGALGGLLPDILDSSPLWSKQLRESFFIIKKYHAFHEYFHWTAAFSEIASGIFIQIALVSASLIYLLR